MIHELLSYGRTGDISDLTGARQREKQVQALIRMNIRFHVAPDGWPRVCWSAVRGMTTADTQPNLAALEVGNGA